MASVARPGSAIALLVVVFALAACGGDSTGSSQESAYAEALATSLKASFAEDDIPVTDGEASCVGEGVVDVIGADTLADAGLTPESISQDSSPDLDEAVPNLTPEQADGLADAIFDCLDVGGLVAAGLAQGASEDGVDLSQEKIDCIGDNFESSEALRELFARSIVEGTDPDFGGADADLLGELIGDCLSVQDLLEIGQAVENQ